MAAVVDVVAEVEEKVNASDVLAVIGEDSGDSEVDDTKGVRSI